MSEKEYLYSEIFDSIQGEGTYTGVHSLWLRFFLCNLQVVRAHPSISKYSQALNKKNIQATRCLTRNSF